MLNTLQNIAITRATRRIQNRNSLTAQRVAQIKCNEAPSALFVIRALASRFAF